MNRVTYVMLVLMVSVLGISLLHAFKMQSREGAFLKFDGVQVVATYTWDRAQATDFVLVA